MSLVEPDKQPTYSNIFRMAIRMAIMRTNLFKGVKIAFIGLLVVNISNNISLISNTSFVCFPKAAFLYSMAVPSISKYLERAVMVEISRIPQAENGQPRLEPLAPPLLTFCPYKNLEWVRNTNFVLKIFQALDQWKCWIYLGYYFSAGWNTEPLEGEVFSDYVMTFCNKTNMEGQSVLLLYEYWI